MRLQPLLLLLLLSALPLLAVVESNSEGDALNEWKIQLTDPYNVLQSWDPTLSNPCTWFHISCNSNNSVTRVDLGSAGLSGILIPQLATLTNLQFLEVSNNNISGSIPYEFGNLKNLVSLGLNRNKLNGSIPESLGNLRSLRYMSLSSNKLSGRIPIQVIQLVFWGNLRVMNVSDNQLAGSGHHMHTTRTGVAVTTIIQDAKA